MDYHCHRDGISVPAISEQLAADGFELISQVRYNAHEMSLVGGQPAGTSAAI